MNEIDYYPPIIKLDQLPMPTITSPAKEYEMNKNWKLPYNPYPVNLTNKPTFSKHSISVDNSKPEWSSLWPSNSMNKIRKRKS